MNVPMEHIKTYQLMIINSIPIVVGVSLIITGTIERRDKIFELFKDDILNSREWCVFLGSFTVVSSMLGYVALVSTGPAMRWLRWLYYISTFLIICSLIACADMARHLRNSLMDDMRLLYSQYNIESEINERVDAFQRTLQCCGFNGATDLEVQQENALVRSCCPQHVEMCDKSKAYPNSCSSKTSSIISFSNTITALTLVTAIFLIILLIIILIMTCHIKSHGEEDTVDDDLVGDLDYTDFESSIPASRAPSHYEHQTQRRE